MKRTLVAVGLAIAALIPATIGLLGNSSFAQSVPVRVPQVAQVLPGEATPTPTPSATSSHDAGDDHGGDRPRDSRVEPGDDRDQSPSPSATSSHDASDDRRGRGSDDSGSDGRGRGSDDSGRDDHGGSGHGSDD